MLGSSIVYGDSAHLNEPAFARNRASGMGIPRNMRILLFVLLLFASAEFVVRGPVRIVRRASTTNDLSAPYVGARAWVEGLSPYSSTVFISVWRQSGGQGVAEPGSSGTKTPYPLTCLLLLAPFALFTWPTASALFGLLLSLMIVAAIWLLSGLPELTEDGWRKWLFISLGLALAPIHTGIGQDNVSILSISFLLISFWGSRTQRPILAGLCCGAGVALKPQLGLFLLFYYGISRQWRAFGVSLASTCLIAAVAIGRLQFLGLPWLSAYLANNKQTLADPINGITAANWRRFQMVNLQVLWYAVTKSEHMANVLALLVTFALLLAGVVVLLRRGRSIPSVLGVSFLAVICLLPVYHRNYDAALLIFPLLWNLSATGRKTRIYHRMALFLMLPFAAPGAWMLESLQNAGRIPTRLTARWWWDPVIMSHQIWALLLLAVLLVVAMWRQQSRQTRSAPALGCAEGD
jgi:hypothetical protein